MQIASRSWNSFTMLWDVYSNLPFPLCIHRHTWSWCVLGELLFIKVSKSLLPLWTLDDASFKKHERPIISSNEGVIEVLKSQPKRSLSRRYGRQSPESRK
jgi:hypothetical protein